MYSLVRRYIKTGVAFLFAGILLGSWMLARRELYDEWPSPFLVSAHAHVVFVGFVLNLILGVALWLFPRAAKSDTRYSPSRIGAAYWILTAATALRFAAEVLRAWSSWAVLRWTVLAGGVGQGIALALYFWTMWSRIRPVGSHLREAEGERF